MEYIVQLHIEIYLFRLFILTSGSTSPWIPMDSTSTRITVIASQTAFYQDVKHSSLHITWTNIPQQPIEKTDRGQLQGRIKFRF